MLDNAEPLLSVNNLVTGYGKRQVLTSISIKIEPAKVVALIGHNGAGKSTLLKAIFGLVPIWAGEVVFDGRRLTAPAPRDLLRLGVSYVPQGNRVFTDLGVQENLELGGVTLGNRRVVEGGIERALDLFPALRAKIRQRAGTLSGGEQQMLALSNALILSPRLLLLDEPSLGLAPRLVSTALQRVRQISQQSGAAVLVVEQKVRDVLNISDSVFVLRNGRVSFSGSASELHDEARLREVYL